MKEKIVKRVANLLSVKSLVTLILTAVFAYMAVTGVVLGAYFNKSKAENTKGGIVYDAALGVPNSDTDL